MTFTSPFTAVTGAIITAAGWNTSGRDNINHMRAIIPDPGGSAAVLKRATSTTASWGQVATAEIATSAITTSLIADDQVTNAKMANDSVGTNEIIDSAVTEPKLAINSVTNAKMANDSVGTNEIIDSAVTEPKLASSAVTAAKIASGAAATNIGAGGVSAAMLASGAAVSNIGYTPAQIESGTYVGNDAATRTISTSGGFTPKFVVVHRQGAGVGIYHNNGYRTTLTYSGNTIVEATGNIVSGGFEVYAGGNNANGVTYYYTAIG